MKILIATEKPFALKAISKIGEIFENEGHELILLEKYSSKKDLVDSIKDIDAIIIK